MTKIMENFQIHYSPKEKKVRISICREKEIPYFEKNRFRTFVQKKESCELTIGEHTRENVKNFNLPKVRVKILKSSFAKMREKVLNRIILSSKKSQKLTVLLMGSTVNNTSNFTESLPVRLVSTALSSRNFTVAFDPGNTKYKFNINDEN